ncbi:hypothetical protein MPH_00414 [Macrophomina phaseolina MS6]|uniref:Uncharacterized protein n=2 Tax=Macrophomina phaseolina TaxID=35725 RepID=K2SZY7_MACPH|nr:hypothetical protein MPH_00414 [Macrophomina phaseolina MS6]
MDMGYVEKSVEIDYAASHARTHRSFVPPRRTGEIAPKRPRVYQMRAPGVAELDNRDADCAVAEELSMLDMTRDVVEDEDGRFKDDLAGLYLPRDRSETWAGMDFDSVEDSPEGSISRHKQGAGRDIGRKSDEREREGVLAGFWRPHKLY